MTTIQELYQSLIKELLLIKELDFNINFKYSDLDDTKLPIITLAAILDAFNWYLTQDDVVLLYAQHYEQIITIDSLEGYKDYSPEDMGDIIDINIPGLNYKVKLIFD